MAKCDVCGKGVSFGIKVSHSHRRSNKMWKSNVRRIKAVVDGSVKHVNVCTKCLRSGKVQRAADFRRRKMKTTEMFFLRREIAFLLFFRSLI